MAAVITRKWVIGTLLTVVPALALYFLLGREGEGEKVLRAPVVPAASRSPVLEEIPAGQGGDPPAREYVTIGGETFEVPEPWRGNRIAGETDPGRLRFAMIPTGLALDNREIYVTVETRDAFVRMAGAAAADGVSLLVDSGYRSAAYQGRIFQRKMAEGESFADIARWVAPPGYSEHMLGTTVDLVPSKWTFSNTAADVWLRENGARFSFYQTYPESSERGFAWEPWHWRYDRSRQ